MTAPEPTVHALARDTDRQPAGPPLTPTTGGRRSTPAERQPSMEGDMPALSRVRAMCQLRRRPLRARHGAVQSLQQQEGDEAVTVRTTSSVPAVPNQPKTPNTPFRIPPDIKAAAVARAKAEGRTLTEVVVEHLAKYGKGKPDPPKE